jgi:hypothetical protein
MQEALAGTTALGERRRFLAAGAGLAAATLLSDGASAQSSKPDGASLPDVLGTEH